MEQLDDLRVGEHGGDGSGKAEADERGLVLAGGEIAVGNRGMRDAGSFGGQLGEIVGVVTAEFVDLVFVAGGGEDGGGCGGVIQSCGGGESSVCGGAEDDAMLHGGGEGLGVIFKVPAIAEKDEGQAGLANGILGG